MQKNQAVEETRQSVPLSRALGLGSALSVVAGSVIGSGVFLVASDISKNVPSGTAALGIWLVAGLLSLLGGLVFAELGAMFPGAGGQYLYFKEAFGPRTAFLFGWTHTLILAPGTLAALAVGFAQFCSGLWGISPVGVNILATVSLILLTQLNLLGVKRGADLLNLMTLLKIGVLIALACAGFFALTQSGAGLSSVASPEAAAAGLPSLGIALIAALWAFDGWVGLSQVAGEVKNPSRNIPLATLGGIALVTLLYMGVNLAYYRLLPASTIAGSQFVAADAVRILAGEGSSRFMSFVMALSTLGCLGAAVITAARVTFAVGQQGDFPKALSRVHEKHRVPSVALITQAVLAIALVWWGTYNQLFTYVVCAAFVFYGLTGVALLALRRSQPGTARPYKVPLYPVLPTFYILFCVALIANTLRETARESLLGVGIVLLGIPAQLFFRWWNGRHGVAELPTEGALERG